MSLVYANCLLALRAQMYGPWELSSLLGDNKIPQAELSRLMSQWYRTPLEHRHQLRLQLRSQHPSEFARAARQLIGPQQSITTRLRCAVYFPELWSDIASDLSLLRRFVIEEWAAEFGSADDTFLASLPTPIFSLMIDVLGDSWWWRGQWTQARREGAAGCQNRQLALQLALLAGDAEQVAANLGAEQKRQGYAMVWEFLQGDSHAAYLALRKLVDRRRPDLPVFSAWVALWARIVALSQGDQHLFQDRRLSGNVEVESALGDLDLKATPEGPEIELGRGLAQCALWIARQHHPNRLRL